MFFFKSKLTWSLVTSNGIISIVNEIRFRLSIRTFTKMGFSSKSYRKSGNKINIHSLTLHKLFQWIDLCLETRTLVLRWNPEKAMLYKCTRVQRKITKTRNKRRNKNTTSTYRTVHCFWFWYFDLTKGKNKLKAARAKKNTSEERKWTLCLNCGQLKNPEHVSVDDFDF